MDKQLVSKLLENKAQFGYKTSRFHPDMTPYVWGARNGVHLIDLNKTAFLLNHACDQIKKASEFGGQILWVGTKRSAQDSIADVAEKLGHPVVIHRWIGGTLTNSEQVRKAVTKLLHMREVMAKPMGHLKKKQLSMLKKDLDRLEKNVAGIIKLKGKPSLLVVVDVKREMTAILEAKMCNIPVIALADTNAPAGLVNTVVPVNDDAKEAISFVIQSLMDASLEGQAVYREKNPEAAAEEAAAQKRAKYSLGLNSRPGGRPDASRAPRPRGAGPKPQGGRPGFNKSGGRFQKSGPSTIKKSE